MKEFIKHTNKQMVQIRKSFYALADLYLGKWCRPWRRVSRLKGENDRGHKYTNTHTHKRKKGEWWRREEKKQHIHTEYIQTLTFKHQRHLYVEIIYFTIHRAIFLADNRTFVVGFLLFYTKFTSIIHSAVAEKLFTHKKKLANICFGPRFCISHKIFGHGSFKQKQ